MINKLAYLDALGIDVWVARNEQPSVANAAPSLPEAHLSVSKPVPASVVDTIPLSERPSSGSKSGSDIYDLDWEALTARVSDCRQCGLCETRTQTVFGVGNRQADLMVVGEAPGADEDRQGEPFVGRARKLLNNMMKAIGFARDEIYIANILKCRPPNNRDPQVSEVEQCIHYLRRQVALIQPKLILAVGRIAAQNLLQTDTPLGKMRGKVYEFGDPAVPVIVTYHPAYLLRTPGDKSKAWEDLQFAHARLKS